MTSSNPDVGSSQVSERDVRKVATVSLVGASVEWFDFFLFGTAAALVFPTVFFSTLPEDDPLFKVLVAFGVFGVGFLARPLGGIVWGHFGDKIGRKQAFLAALMLMATSTFLIGILPSAATIGVLAPILLTVLRFFQGLAVGGQWGGAALLATESAPANRRGFYGSFAQLGVPIGVLLGMVAYFLLYEVMGEKTFLDWGWRIPFIASVLFVAIVIYTKKRLEETPEFKRLQEHAAQKAAAKADDGEATPVKSPVTDVLKNHLDTVLLAGGAYIVTTAVYYLYITFMLVYNEEVLQLAPAYILVPIATANVLMLFVVPWSAGLSDRIGRGPIYIAGAIGTALWAYPFFMLVDTKNIWLMIIALCVGLFFLAIMYGLMAAYFAELFPPEVRYSGASLGYQLGSVLGGAMLPLVAVELLRRTGNTLWISAIVIALSALAIFCIMFITKRQKARGSTVLE